MGIYCISFHIQIFVTICTSLTGVMSALNGNIHRVAYEFSHELSCFKICSNDSDAFFAVQRHWSSIMFVGLPIVLEASNCVFLTATDSHYEKNNFVLIQIMCRLADRLSATCASQFWLFNTCLMSGLNLQYGLGGDICTYSMSPHHMGNPVPHDKDKSVSED